MSAAINAHIFQVFDVKNTALTIRSKPTYSVTAVYSYYCLIIIVFLNFTYALYVLGS